MKRIAVIGCGAIADSFHLPGLRRLGMEAVLVDPDLSRARTLAERHGLRQVAAHHSEVLDQVDAAIIASPHPTHVPIGHDLIAGGVPFLSEKPLGTSSREVEALVEEGERMGVVIAVNQTRRFIPASRAVRDWCRDGSHGGLLQVQVAEGDRFGWPAATPSMFGAGSGGKGVLLDIGAHVLDLLVWWMGDEFQVESHYDDSFGGSEAVTCTRLLGPGGVEVEVRLSWLEKQENSFRIRGREAELEWDVHELDRFRVREPGGRAGRVRKLRGAPGGFSDLAPEVIGDFVEAVRSGRDPVAPGRSVLPSIRLIEEAYARRERFSLPWHPFRREFQHVR